MDGWFIVSFINPIWPLLWHLSGKVRNAWGVIGADKGWLETDQKDWRAFSQAAPGLMA